MTGVRSPCSEPARLESVVCAPLSLVWVNGDLAPAVGKTRVNQDKSTLLLGCLQWGFYPGGSALSSFGLFSSRTVLAKDLI